MNAPITLEQLQKTKLSHLCQKSEVELVAQLEDH